METRTIGSLEVSVVGLGTNNFGSRMDQEQATEVVRACLDSGVTLFDTADLYGDMTSEELLGRALGSRRDEAIITTKFGIKIDDERPGGAKPEYVRRSAEESLKRLGTDRIDLYLLHRPDPTTPIADTLHAMNELVAEGKVREIGCSAFSVEQLREAAAAVEPGQAGFVNLQSQYSLLDRDVEADVLPECERTGMSFVPYFPLASGLLTGKYRLGEPAPAGTRLATSERLRASHWSDARLEVVERLRTCVQAQGHTLLEAAFAWLLHRPEISSVIAGASNAAQVKDNVAAAAWTMTDAEYDSLSDASSPK